MATFINQAIIKANPKARRLILSFSLGALSFGGLSIFSGHLIYQGQSSSQLSTNPIAASISHALLLTAILMGFGLAGFGIWMSQLGAQSLRQGCYPPKRSIMVCDTEVVTGWRATVKALTAMMLAITSFLGTLGVYLEILGFLNL